MDEGYERFEVTADDLEDAFDPTSRKRRKFTKNDAIYGMWADHDSDEEDDRSGRRKKDYASMPMSFVSGGVAQSEAEKKRKTDRERGEDDTTDLSTRISSKSKGSSRTSHHGSKAQTFAGLGKPVDKEFGSWEQHTTGIGQKLLRKMGYKPGQGLGKEGTGIATPIVATVRKGKGAIGAHGSEGVRDPRENDEVAVLAQQKTVIRHKKQWRKKDGEQMTAYDYKTVDEVLQEKDSRQAGGWDASELSKVKVIDMTGKETKVLSGYHAIHTQRGFEDADSERIFDVAELRHNLDLLIDMSEARIIECTKKLDYEKNLLVTLKDEEKGSKEALDKDDVLVDRLNAINDRVERAITKQNELSLDECLDLFNDLFDNYNEQYRYYEMDLLAGSTVIPIMQRFFAGWNPLVDPNFGWGELQEWKRLLEPPQRSFEASRNVVNSYHNILWEVWMPFVRTAILNWSPRSSPEVNPIIELIHTWNSTLPQWMLDNIVEQQVLPRLVTEMEEWDPTMDPMPVHHWIHPWLPYLDKRLEVVYSILRQKLGIALTRWHPSDMSAKLMLQPWIPLFSKATMDQFLIRNILPKLQELMQTFQVNPKQQELRPLDYIFEWLDLMPLNSMVMLFEKYLFPQWFDILYRWLNMDPNLQEVSQWYLEWKKLFPEALRNHPNMQKQWNAALMAMNQAATGEEITVQIVDAQLPSAPAPPPSPPAKEESVRVGFAKTFRDLVEEKANERGILFVRNFNRNYQGKPVFQFGKRNVYIDRNVIFVQAGTAWAPIALETLLQQE
ncbi:tuftelin-interacting protein 11-like [Paramacrobiotus metropolitanus]|uniref:tuftelin-interacting protein 11-like n=1 Tax=Paramacrobiotus metropolitanus TaxID=2943436 RepID=UPI0024460C10|nr:tuftelin-interacting protein 11-like [Paramacrobiotus metropolitanus]